MIRLCTWCHKVKCYAKKRVCNNCLRKYEIEHGIKQSNDESSK